MRGRTLTVVTAVTAAVLLAGCGGDEDADTTSPTTSAATTTGAATDATTSDDPVDQAARDAGIDPTSPPTPIASVTAPGSGVDRSATEMTVDLVSLRRQDDLMVLTVGVTPDEDSSSRARSYFGWMSTRWAPQVVDTTNLKVHDVVTADGTQVATPSGPTSTSFGPGQTLYLYAVFAAPPQDVSTVTVKVADGAPAMTGVTIR